MNNHDELDSILGDALAEYREAEPLAGLEGRILHRLRSQQEHSRPSWWRWSAAVACAGLIAIALWFGIHASTRRVVSPQVNAVQQSPQVIPQATPTQHVAKRQPLAHPPNPSVEAKLAPRSSREELQRDVVGSVQVRENRPAQFPTPVPLTSEEHALVAVAQVRPEVLLTIPEAAQDLSIPDIQIKPLRAPQADAEGGKQ